MDSIPERVTRLEEKVSTMDKDLGIFSTTVERFSTVIDKLDTTLDNVQLSMVELTSQTKQNKEKIDNLEADSKINVIRLIKDNFVWLILVGGIVLYALGIIKF